MYRRSFASLIAGLSICAVAAGAVPSALASSSGITSGGRLLKTHAREVLPTHGGAATSLNWGGYAVTPASKDVTGVSSTFVVPKAGLVPPGFAATWTGIGGYNSSDLIQAGVTENSLPTNPISGAQYGAWYEILPASETAISDCTGNSACTVNPGDTVTVNIHLTSPGHWDVSLSDPAEGWTFDKAVPYTSTESSAEWILEAPTVIAQTILAGTGTVQFGPTSTFTTASGGTQTIAQGNPTAIALSPGLVNEATPSALGTDGESFNVCAYKQTCPAP
jgi:Peptidase A4 family